MVLRHTNSQEKIKLLGDLSLEESAFSEQSVLRKKPDYEILLINKKFINDEIDSLESLHNMSLTNQVTVFKSNPTLIHIILRIFQEKHCLSVIKYISTLLYQVIRDDVSVLDIMISQLKNTDIFTIFYALLAPNCKLDCFTADKSVFFLTSFMARAPHHYFTDNQLQEIIKVLIHDNSPLSVFGRLDSMKNLLKLDRYRKAIWESSTAIDLIYSNLSVSKQETVYTAVFCCWLLTFDKYFIEQFAQAGATQKICAILKESKTEKVVRICIHTLLNCLTSDLAVEILIQENAVQTLTVLDYEKWRDEELYKEIRDGLSALQNKIKLFSNFDRYKRELDSGALTWSFLHSEKFWHENVMHFEANEFQAVKQLVELLKSSDPITLAVACFDLGEFARLYPAGKKIIQKLKAKELTMNLMSHKDRNVSCEALLSIQKIMLDHWKTAADNIISTY